MNAGSALATVAAITALSAGGVFAVGPMRAASADTDAPQQKVYLDPQTGEVLDTPPAKAQEPRRAGAARRGAPAQDEAWTNEEGADMLTPAPGSAPTTQAIRCADGTLRMGHAENEGGATTADSGRGALCDRALR